MKTFVLMTACLAAGLASTGASARPTEPRLSVAVPYGDLDLTRAAGRATLQGRIYRASAQVCRQAIGWDPMGSLAASQCLAEARLSARTQVATAIARARQRAPGAQLAAQ